MLTAEVSEERTNEVSHEDELLHGAHTACQADSPFVTLVCGRVAGWEEKTDNTRMSPCPMCWNAEACSICGTPLHGYRSGE